MAVELGIWRIDGDLEKLEVKSLDLEERLEEFLEKDISIASPNWMIIGRQVCSDYGKYIDLLALDRDGNLVVIELKRNKTPRDVVAQLLDYASWIKKLKDDEIASIYETYLNKYRKNTERSSLDQAFLQYFNMEEMPEELNESHQLVVVASQLDDSTERIVNYLADEHNVPINALFFRIFRDGDREYLSSMWFKDPFLPSPIIDGEKVPWNGEYYVSFGHDENGRRWEDAMKYGFVSGGGGTWYSKTLDLLEVGNRIWVNIPSKGYVGIGVVLETKVKVDKFTIDDNGIKRLLTPDDVIGKNIFSHADDEDKSEYLVKVKWERAFNLNDAIKEKGFFGNQNTVCKPIAKKWQHTVERLKIRFGI